MQWFASPAMLLEQALCPRHSEPPGALPVRARLGPPIHLEQGNTPVVMRLPEIGSPSEDLAAIRRGPGMIPELQLHDDGVSISVDQARIQTDCRRVVGESLPRVLQEAPGIAARIVGIRVL